MPSKQEPYQRAHLNPGEKVLLERLAKIRIRIRKDKLSVSQTLAPETHRQQDHTLSDK